MRWFSFTVYIWSVSALYASSGLALMQPGTHVNACIVHYLLRFFKLVFNSPTLTQSSENKSNARCSVSSVIQTASLRNSILMTRHYPDLGNAFDWSCRVGNLLQPIRRTIQIWVVTRHQYGISALVSQTSFCRETSGGVARCRLFSQATRQLKLPIVRITKGRSSAHFWDVWISDEVTSRCLIYLSEKQYKEVKKNTWIFLFSIGWKFRSFN